jgi:hypothetical protein
LVLKNSVFWDITSYSYSPSEVAFIFKVEEHAELATCFMLVFLLVFFDPENGGDMFLRNVG